MTAVKANSPSGQQLNYISADDPRAKAVPAHNTWHALPLGNPYRIEWDTFARLLGFDPRNQENFSLITDALRRHHNMVMQANSRHVTPRVTARADAAAQAKAALFAPAEVRNLSGLTNPNGGLTSIVKIGAVNLAQNPALANFAWGTSLQLAVTNPKTVASFYLGVAQGVFDSGKEMVVGLATFAGKILQYGADSIMGPAFDLVRSQLPSSAQSWMRDNAMIPSVERAAASTQKITDAVGKVASYIASHSAEQVGNDIAAYIEKNWVKLTASHAAATAEGPEAQARWWGQIAGRAIFEVAAVAVPVTKVVQLAKAARVTEVVAVVKGADMVGDASVLAQAAKLEANGLTPIAATGARTAASVGFDTTNLESKLAGYLLDASHPQNQSKANWFKQALGFEKSNWQELASQLKFDESLAVKTKVTQYGTTYEQSIRLLGPNGNTINTTFVFMRDSDGVVKLVTGIPTKK